MVSFAYMRTARAKVVKGRIVTRTKFPEGTKLFLVVDKPHPEIELDEDDEKVFDEAMVAVRRGKTIPLESSAQSCRGSDQRLRAWRRSWSASHFVHWRHRATVAAAECS